MAISSPGIGSNLDINSIIQGLMNAERGPLNLVNQQKADFQSSISAYGTLKSSLASFQDAVAKLSDMSKFTAQTAVASDPAAFTASASGDAVESNYAIKVVQLAQPQKVAMAGVANQYSVIGTGTLTISFGSYDSVSNSFTLNADKAAKAIAIPTASNSLAGVRDAINAADAGVTATIVNDGQLSRLVVTSKDSGTSNSIRIAVTDDDGAGADNAGLSQLAFDPTLTAGSGNNLTVLQSAKDAIVDIDGVRVTKPGNTIDDALDGVTFNLLKADPDAALNLSVTRNQAAIQSSVAAFVKAYNDINQNLRSLTSYDVTTKVGGALAGDSATRSIATQIKQVMTNALSGAGELKSLTQIGVSFQRDGTLALDSDKLKAAVASNAGDIAYLFAAAGRATDLQVKQVGQTDKTRAGVYAVNVTQLATQGNLLGNNATPDLNIVAGSNDALDFKIDGNLYSLKLKAASYASLATLGSELQTQLSAAGSSAKVVFNGGNLQILSSSYGSSSTVTLQGGNGAGNLFGASPAASAGLDVAGSINGVAATGKGQILTGAVSDASEGLALTIAGGSLGDRGTVSYTTGYAYQLDHLVEGMLADDGLLAARTDGINSSIERLGRQQELLQNRLDAVEKRYRAQFTALDVMISGLQQTSSYLTQQLAQISANNSN